jgi:cyanophycinase
MSDKNFPLFLIGGGWQPEAFIHTYGPFVEAASKNKNTKILLVLASKDEANKEELIKKFQIPFQTLSVMSDEITAIFVSKSEPLTKNILVSTKPTGIFICGGTTPLYQEALCIDKGWLDYLEDERLPYCGFSAGASIAADKAIVGGWKLCGDGQNNPIIDPEVAEDLECLTVRNGLGLLPFSIDVHCGQWGTITRLIHTVNQGMVESGWAIDEDTMLKVDGNRLSVHGFGQTYRVKRQAKDKLIVEVFTSGCSITQ